MDKKQEKLKGQIKNAITYPIVIALMVVIIMVVLVTKVLPIFGDVFANLGGSVPLSVALVSQVSKVLVYGFSAVFAGVIFFVLYLLGLSRTQDGKAKARWEAAHAQAQAAAAALLQHQTAQAATQTRRDNAQARQAEYAQRLSADGTDASAHHAAIAALLAEPPSCERLDAQERQAQAQASAQVDKQAAQLNALRQELIRQMGRAHKEDRGALADQPQEVEALAPYLERLRVLEEEALPEKRQRFQDYLNSASDQGVSTLLSGIEAQVTEITERIADLNETLARVDFQSGRYLQLAPQPVIHPSLQALHKAMAHLRSERLQGDGGQSHYQALQAMVELLREHASNRRTKAAQALLDARYRLQFTVHVLDRDSGQVLERRTGSQGGSGGEKEIIASYVLTASLSYALCPQGRSQPLFATIVLDEAFSKSSQAVAARIIQALREFSLHALFVTPVAERAVGGHGGDPAFFFGDAQAQHQGDLHALGHVQQFRRGLMVKGLNDAATPAPAGGRKLDGLAGNACVVAEQFLAVFRLVFNGVARVL